MANYNGTIRTNYFSVKDPAALHELISSVSAEDEIQLFEQKQDDGSVKFGFGCYGSIYGIPAQNEEEECEEDLDCFYDALQQLLCEGDAIIIVEAGHEKLRYVVGCCTVITSSDIRGADLHGDALALAKRMLGNPDYQTQMDY